MASLNDPGWDQYFEASGKRHNVDPRLLKAVMFAETGAATPSAARLTATSPDGARGPMQLMPSSFPGVDWGDPKVAIDAAAGYLAQAREAGHGTPQGMLMYYHGGPNTKKWGPKTRKIYPAMVAGYYAQLAQNPMMKAEGSKVAEGSDWLSQYINQRRTQAVPAPSDEVARTSVTTALAPGETASMERSAAAWQDAQANAIGYATRNFQLNQALRSLEGLKEHGGETGPGTETVNHIRAFFLAHTPQFLQSIGIKPDEVRTAKFNELNKYLVQFAQSQANTISPATNTGLATTLMGSPNVELTTSAVDDLLKYTMAVERMKQAGVQNFLQSGKEPQGYLDYATKFYGTADPRAYVLDLVSPEKADEIFDSLKSDDEAKKFIEQVNLAEQLGLIKPRQ